MHTFSFNSRFQVDDLAFAINTPKSDSRYTFEVVRVVGIIVEVIDSEVVRYRVETSNGSGLGCETYYSHQLLTLVEFQKNVDNLIGLVFTEAIRSGPKRTQVSFLNRLLTEESEEEEDNGGSVDGVTHP